MKGLITATLLTFAAVPVSLLFTPQAEATIYDDCYLVSQPLVIRNSASHPGAYADGYNEGQDTARQGDAYKPRTAGGEFARGFEDGYYNRPFTGQNYEVKDRVEYYTSSQCDATFFAPRRHWGWYPYWHRHRFHR